jgi:hypothetical protein
MKLIFSYLKAFRFVLVVLGLMLVAVVESRQPIRSSAAGASFEIQGHRLDTLVRNDFFAGMMGDKVRLDRGMKICEDILAGDPKNAEALVWHGGGLLVRASQAYTNADGLAGDRLWKAGIEEMNQAVAFEPNNMQVKIGRSATIIGYAQSGWDPNDAQSRLLLESAVIDYEKVYGSQKPNFAAVPIHSRGELLFGLASGWSILGNGNKAREYLMLVLAECKNTPYEAEARRKLGGKWPVVIQHDCIGCHVARSNSAL